MSSTSRAIANITASDQTAQQAIDRPRHRRPYFHPSGHWRHAITLDAVQREALMELVGERLWFSRCRSADRRYTAKVSIIHYRGAAQTAGRSRPDGFHLG